MIVLLVFMIIGLLVGVGVLGLALFYHFTYTRPSMKSTEFLLEKSQKLANGWIPPKYADLQTDEERIAAINELMDWQGPGQPGKAVRGE